MKHYPAEIASKTFEKKMMGYDPDEVSDFLVVIAAQIEALLLERNTLRETLKEKELSLHEYKDRDQVLKTAITNASQMSDRMRAETERESKLIINDAQQKAEMITRDARDSLKKTYQEISDLKKVRMQFEANLKAMAQAHLALIDQGERYMPSAQLPNLDFK